MEEVQKYFMEYQKATMNMKYLLEEMERFEYLDKNWKTMDVNTLAKHADYVTTKVMTVGSNNARNYLRGQGNIDSLDGEEINSTALANTALIVPEKLPYLLDKIKTGKVILR